MKQTVNDSKIVAFYSDKAQIQDPVTKKIKRENKSLSEKPKSHIANSISANTKNVTITKILKSQILKPRSDIQNW